MFGKCWISLQLEPPIQGDWPPVGLPRHLLPISPQTSPRQSATTETNPPESSKNFIVTNASFDLRSVMKLVHKLPCCTLHFLLSPISYLAILKIMHNILHWSLWSLPISFVTSSSLGQSRLSAGKALRKWLWGKDTVQAVTFWGVFKVSLRTSSPQLGLGIAKWKGNDL